MCRTKELTEEEIKARQKDIDSDRIACRPAPYVKKTLLSYTGQTGEKQVDVITDALLMYFKSRGFKLVR